jgi:hypothetical protein
MLIPGGYVGVSTWFYGGFMMSVDSLKFRKSADVRNVPGRDWQILRMCLRNEAEEAKD